MSNLERIPLKTQPRVFEEYSIYEMDGQYMMWPFFAFRIRGRIQCNSGCIEN